MPAGRFLGYIQQILRRSILSFAVITAVFSGGPFASASDIEKSGQVGQASMSFDGTLLTVSTGAVTRYWSLTDAGLSTTGLTSDSLELCKRTDKPTQSCDWDLGTKGKAKLVSLTARKENDEGFTSDHLSVVAQFDYPADNLTVRYVVWAYPEAPGLRTQLFVKRLAGRASKTESVAGSQPVIEVLRGRSHTAKGSAQVAGKALASTIWDRKSVELHAKNLQPKSEYLLGLSWWDWGGGGRRQQVRVASVDRENTRTVIADTRLPSWIGRQESPYELTVRVPGSVLLDDSFRILVDNVAGPNANISEVWLYQSGASDQKLKLNGPEERIATLEEDAPVGYQLIAYLDAGSEPRNPRATESVRNRVEQLPLTGTWPHRRAFGLMQGIKTNSNRPILREEDISGPEARVDWANGLVFQSQDRGIVLVKESNKHTALSDNDDLATGGFEINAKGVSVSGSGFRRSDLRSDRFTSCWATWIVPYAGDQWEGNLALKQFDRFRYPIDPERDIYVMANTWGTEDKRPPCLHAAREENVLEELDSVADLGIDVLQIDDGWQTPQWTTAKSAQEVQLGKGALEEFGDYPVYPEGWANVRKKAEELGVTLGLWAAWTAPTDALQSNYDQANFKYFKLDFANLNTKQRFDNLKQKARDVIKHSDFTARVNWDVTETAPRMGYFAGREYGNVYLENRKTLTVRDPVMYVPHKVLADAWHLAKYVNLNKFQVTVQNVENVREGAPTDATLHSHDYAVGIALMSSPIFFQETRYYKPAARERIRDILSTYKEHRHDMYDGYVFPIGNEPNNNNWSGFQNHQPTSGNGYLTIFRERLNKSPTGKFRLRFVQGEKLTFSNLLTGEQSSLTVGPNGGVEFKIPQAPGFLFLKYHTNK